MTRCANCGSPVRRVEVGPVRCEPCLRAIALVVDAIASEVASEVLRRMVAEVDAAAPARIRRAGHSTARAAAG
jgi:hypothetical protein